MTWVIYSTSLSWTATVRISSLSSSMFIFIWPTGTGCSRRFPFFSVQIEHSCSHNCIGNCFSSLIAILGVSASNGGPHASFHSPYIFICALVEHWLVEYGCYLRRRIIRVHNFRFVVHYFRVMVANARKVSITYLACSYYNLFFAISATGRLGLRRCFACLRRTTMFVLSRNYNACVALRYRRELA